MQKGGKNSRFWKASAYPYCKKLESMLEREHQSLVRLSLNKEVMGLYKQKQCPIDSRRWDQRKEGPWTTSILESRVTKHFCQCGSSLRKGRMTPKGIPRPSGLWLSYQAQARVGCFSWASKNGATSGLCEPGDPSLPQEYSLSENHKAENQRWSCALWLQGRAMRHRILLEL